MTDASRRDESTDALLRRVLSPGQEPETTDQCLDGETAAAWLDGKLHGAALERARTHVADCARCQAFMATFVKAEVRVASPAGPAASAAPNIPDTAPGRPWWVWLMPVAAAAAIVIAIALPRNAPKVAQAPAATPAPDQAKVGDAKNALADAPPTEAKKAEEARSNAKDVDQLAKLDARKRQQDAQARPATPVPAAPKPANEAAAAAPPPPTQPTPTPTARDEAQMREIVQAPPLKRDEIGSPDPMIRWRLRRTSVERSIDGGRSWTAVPTGVDAEWTAGAAPTTAAFWIVGRGGMVARSTDGRAFERVPFPELTDLSAVQASDAQTATVATKDGHTYTTTDGGRSWARRDLQETPTAPFNR